MPRAVCIPISFCLPCCSPHFAFVIWLLLFGTVMIMLTHWREAKELPAVSIIEVFSYKLEIPNWTLRHNHSTVFGRNWHFFVIPIQYHAGLLAPFMLWSPAFATCSSQLIPYFLYYIHTFCTSRPIHFFCPICNHINKPLFPPLTFSTVCMHFISDKTFQCILLLLFGSRINTYYYFFLYSVNEWKKIGWFSLRKKV